MGSMFIAHSPRACCTTGGGATQIIMPYLTTAIAHNVPEFEAWRWAFFVPGACHVLIAFLVMVAATVRIFV
jgi:sugar phosphate permease